MTAILEPRFDGAQSSTEPSVGVDGASRPRRTLAWIGAGAGLMVAGLGHLNVVLRPVNNGHHIDHGARYVAFFLVVGAVQLVLGKHLISRPGRAVAVASVATLLGLMVAYITVVVSAVSISATRAPEKVTGTGLIVLASEFIAFVCLLGCLERRDRGLALNAALLAGGSLWIANLTGLLG